jgi:fatty-acyl-CoA synthase
MGTSYILRRLYSLSLASGTTSVPLLQDTIGQNLRKTVSRFPNNDALIVRWQNYEANYINFYKQIQECSKSLMALGVLKGDRVGNLLLNLYIGIWAGNRFEWVILQYATAEIGAIMVALNPAYKEPEIKYALQNSGTAFLFHSKMFRNTNYKTMIENIRNETHLKHVVVLDEDWKTFLAGGKSVSDKSVEEISSDLTSDDPINIQFTSGTTGNPKGALLSHKNILNNGYFVGNLQNLSSNDRLCLPVPFYHCFGMVMGNLACTSRGGIFDSILSNNSSPERIF